ncbi:hypothetical protein AMAG_18825 [Allomyces macrogynus ATCC 38327]|uniref:Uncharacterized protein n=1 Tax=Allomyces macrogynus (strain ATCC 38327) TaxID=578462 RepID=A0A0L0SIB3_ALLM3|nr:hypothetical protein AMAG_18825 [Allomyces macrogynus ATCC 38327]|eukprot:KNE62189.1 hypothetical protein AMAG_18825 [Allomyces macrogynus ATCC 38327]
MSQVKTDAKGYPVLLDVCFTSTALDPTTNINLHVVQVPHQRTRRPPFQLFMVNTPEIARLMVRRCMAAENVAIDLEGHAKIPTLPRARFGRQLDGHAGRHAVLPDETRGAVRRSAFGSRIQLADRHAVPVTLEPRPHVVKSVFYVLLGDIHAQPWKARTSVGHARESRRR